MKYTNRYNDVFEFIKTEDGNIEWKGNFTYCRYGFPNDYSIAYKEYLKNEVPHDHELTLEDFKVAIHKDELLIKKYTEFVTSTIDIINMVDPSGGPYIHKGTDMGIFDKSFKGMLVDEFKQTEYGYLIIIKL